MRGKNVLVANIYRHDESSDDGNDIADKISPTCEADRDEKKMVRVSRSVFRPCHLARPTCSERRATVGFVDQIFFLDKHHVNLTVFLRPSRSKRRVKMNTRDLFVAGRFANRTGRARVSHGPNAEPGSARQRKPCTTAQCIIHSASTPGNDK